MELVVWTTVGFAAMQILMWLRRKIAGANEMARIRADLCAFVEGSRRIYALFPPEYIIAPIEGSIIGAAVESSPAEGTKWMEMTESHVEQVRRGLRLRISQVSKTISSPVFRDALEYTQMKPGKMIRSRLVCILGTELGVPSGASLMILLSQAVELEHCASLLHDDVVDDSDVRRGIESHRKKFGDKLAVLTGDNLISILVEVLTEIANMQVTRAISQSIESLVVGELLQLISKKDSALNYTDRHVEILFPASIIGPVISDPQLFDLLFLYMRKSFFKTASLFATLCQCTGILALGRDSSGLASFGFFFGIAFQIIDDLLDVSDDPDILVGKPVGGVDIRNGTVTLPVLFACAEKAKLAESERKELKEMIHRRFSLGGDPERTLQLILRSDAIALCRKLVNHYLNRCRADLRAAACKKETFPAIEQLLVDYEFRTH